MAKKVVYSLLALSTVPAGANATANTAMPAQANLTQGEMTSADTQEAFRLLDASADDLVTVINNLQNELNAGVNTIEGYINATASFHADVDPEELEKLKEKLADYKVKIADIDQELDNIKSTADTQTAAELESNYARVSAARDVNEFLQKLDAILAQAKADFDALNNASDNLVANDANQAVVADLKAKLADVETALATVADDNNQKGALQDLYNELKGDIDTFAANADEAFANGTAKDFNTDTTAIQDKINELTSKIDAANDNYAAYQEVKAAIDAATAAYNDAYDRIQKGLTGKEVYKDLLKDAQKQLTDEQQKLAKAEEDNEAAYAAQESKAKKDDLLDEFSSADEIKAIADNLLAKVADLDAKKQAMDTAIATLQENLDGVEVKDEFSNKAALDAEKEGIQGEIDDLTEAVDQNYKNHDMSAYATPADVVDPIQTKIDALVGKIAAAQENTNGYDDAIATIGDLQVQLNTAKGLIKDLKYGETPVNDSYTALVAGIQGQIDQLQADADAANANGTAKDFNDNLDVTAIETAITEFADNAKPAYDNYEAVIAVIDANQQKLNELQNKWKDQPVYDQTVIESLQGQIDDAQAAVDDIIANKAGQEHWEAMLALVATDIDTDLKTAINRADANFTSQQEAYDADQAHEARIAITKEINTRLANLNSLIDLVEAQIAEGNLGNSEDEIKDKFQDIKDERDNQNNIFDQNKEYDNRADNREPDDVKAFSELSKVNEAIIDLTSQLNNLQTTVAETQDNVKENNTAKGLAANILSGLQDYFDSTKNYVATNDADVEVLFEDDFDAIQGEINDLTGQVNEAAAAENLNSKLEKIESDAEDIMKELDEVKADADKAQHNYNNREDIKQRYQDVVATFEAESTGGGLEAADNGDAYDHYKTLLNEYESELDDIHTRIENIALADATDELKETYIRELDELEGAIKTVVADAIANLEAYNKQKTEKYDVQKTWNEVYTRINANDESKKKQEWLDQLDDIQDEINEYSLKIDDYYKGGQSVEMNDEVMRKLAEIKNKINDLDAQQSEGYDQQIADENKAIYDAFWEAIALTDAAFKQAVNDIVSYRDVKNTELHDAINAIAVDYHDKFYAENQDPYRQKIQDLKDEVTTVFGSVQSPDHFDSEESYIAKAHALTNEINATFDDFMTEVQQAVADFWTGKKAALDQKVVDAKAEIADYSAAAQENAFKNVEDKINAADALATAATAQTINEFSDALNHDLIVNIDKNLALDINAAAKNDIDPRITDARTQIEADLTYLNSLPDGDYKTQKLAEYNTLVAETVDAAQTLETNTYTLGTLATARPDILDLLTQFDNSQLVQEVKDNQQAAIDLDADIAELQQKLDDAAAAIAALMVGDQFAERIAKLQGYIDYLEEVIGEAASTGDLAPNKDIADYMIESIGNGIDVAKLDAVAAEKTKLNEYVEPLQEEYNRFAANIPEGATVEEQAEHAAQAAEMRDDIEAIKEALADTDLTVEKALEVEKEVARLTTELANLNGEEGTDVNATAKSNLDAQVAAIETKAQLEGLESVKGKFAEELEAIDAEFQTVKDAIENEENVAFYEEKLAAQLNAIDAELDEVIAKAQAEKAKVEANQAAYIRLMAQITELEGVLEAAKEKAQAYEYAYFDGSWYETDIDNLKDNVETQYRNVELTAESSIDYDIEYISDLIAGELNGAAYQEVNYFVNEARAAYNAIFRSLERKNYAASVWSDINAELSAINTEIGNVDNANEQAYHIYENAADNVAALKERLAAVNDLITALAKKVTTTKLGDADGNGVLNTTDYVKVVYMITGRTAKPEPGTPEFAAVDINEDGQINVGDATAIINLMLYGNVSGEVAPARSMGNGAESVTVTELAQEGNVKHIALNLNNNKAYTAMQMDIVLPEGMTLVGESTTARANNHELVSGDVDGVHRVVVSSATNAAFNGNSGAVAYIDVEVNDSYMGGEISFDNVLFAEQDAQLTKFAVSAGETNGINAVEEDSLMGKVYNMGGRVVNALKKGVNIVRGNDGQSKKVVVK